MVHTLSSVGAITISSVVPLAPSPIDFSVFLIGVLFFLVASTFYLLSEKKRGT
jgi:hypothetical protein